ncbi:MAG: hypothetical protein ACI9Y1_001943 [Lentisphaeria bacterium]|jgi:hypothetical protein
MHQALSKSTFSGKNFDKRMGADSIPVNLKEYLNQDQMVSLRQMESFGWHLAFVRRNALHCPVAVVANSLTFAVLERDGSINTDTDLGIRY